MRMIVKIFLVATLVLISSCQEPQIRNKLSKTELSLIREHVEHLEFVDTGCAVPEPAIPNKAVIDAVIKANSIGTDEHFPYTALFVLKCHYTALIHINQSHWLMGTIVSYENGREKHSYEYGRQYSARMDMAAEFFRLCGIGPGDSEGWGHSSFAYNLAIENRSRFDDYSSIQDILNKIAKEQQKIDEMHRDMLDNME